MNKCSVIICGLVLAALPFSAAIANDDEACQNAWNQSPASSECDAGGSGQAGSGGLYVEWRSGGMYCIVSASCPRTNASSTGSQQWQYNNLKVYSMSDMKKLRNCDGTLTIGDC